MAEGERTEPPSPRRLEKAIQEGNVPQSLEFSGAVGLLVFVVMLRIYYPRFIGSWERMFMAILSSASVDTLLHDMASSLMSTLPVMLVPLLGVLATTLFTSGLRLYPKRMVPKLDGLNPAQNIKRIFSMQGLEQMGIGLLKIIVLSFVAYFLIRGRLVGVMTGTEDPVQFLNLSAVIATDILLYLVAVYVAIGFLDYWFQRQRWWNSLKMTKEEVKEEMKSMEGDPTVKSRLRARMRQYAMRRSLTDVKKATVVITNPTEYAVALRYERNMVAPEVVAKGAGWLAQRIKEEARKYNVPIVARPELARTIFRKVEVGDYITPDLYQAVASVLVEVMRKKKT
jgi:flagellar biosynthetic protein FlhB